jgi:hypothetical protein
MDQGIIVLLEKNLIVWLDLIYAPSISARNILAETFWHVYDSFNHVDIPVHGYFV